MLKHFASTQWYNYRQLHILEYKRKDISSHSVCFPYSDIGEDFLEEEEGTPGLEPFNFFHFAKLFFYVCTVVIENGEEEQQEEVGFW